MIKKEPNLVEIIKDSGISVRKLAKDCGIPEQRVYAWINKGSRPKYEDELKVREYLEEKVGNKSNAMPPSDLEATVAVVLSRLSVLLSEQSGRSALIELEQMKKDAQELAKLKA